MSIFLLLQLKALTTAGVTGTGADTIDPFISAASGTPTIIGTAVDTIGAFVSAAVGSPTVIGTAVDLIGAFLSAAAGTPTIVGTAVDLIGAFVSAATGWAGIITGTAADLIAPFVSTANGISGIGTVCLITNDGKLYAAGAPAFPDLKIEQPTPELVQVTTGTPVAIATVEGAAWKLRMANNQNH